MVLFQFIKLRITLIFLNKRAIPDYKSIKGNLGVYILKRDEKDIT